VLRSRPAAHLFSLFRGPLCWHSILHLWLGALAGAGLGAVLNGVGAGVGQRPARWVAVALAAGALTLWPLLAPRALAWLALGVVGVGVARAVRRDVGTALVLASALGAVWTWVPAPKVRGEGETRTATSPTADHSRSRSAWPRVRRCVPCGRCGGTRLAPRETSSASRCRRSGDAAGLPGVARPALRAPDGAGLGAPRGLSVDRGGARPGCWALDVECIVSPPMGPSDGLGLAGRGGARRAGRSSPRRRCLSPERRGGGSDEEALAAASPRPSIRTPGRRIGNARDAAPAARIQRRAPAPGRVKRGGRRGYLVVSETWYPGWRARIDGVPAQVERADYALLGVPLPPGARGVELWYEPRGFAAARWATVLGLGLMVAGGGASIRTRRRA
jgi:hypothetical protein